MGEYINISEQQLRFVSNKQKSQIIKLFASFFRPSESHYGPDCSTLSTQSSSFETNGSTIKRSAHEMKLSAQRFRAQAGTNLVRTRRTQLVFKIMPFSIDPRKANP